MDNIVYEQILQRKNADLDRRSYLYDIVELVNNLKYLKIPKRFKDAVGQCEFTYIRELDNFIDDIDDSYFDLEIPDLFDNCVKPSAVSVVVNGSSSSKIIKRIRGFTEYPVLMRDYVISPIQIFEAKEAGASAFTLMPSIISYRSINEFLSLANSLGLDCVIEVSDTSCIQPLVDAGVKYLLITPSLLYGAEGLMKQLSGVPSHIVKIVQLPNFDIGMKSILLECGVNSVIV